MFVMCADAVRAECGVFALLCTNGRQCNGCVCVCVKVCEKRVCVCETSVYV